MQLVLKPYFFITLLIWVVVFFTLLTLWLLDVFHINLGDFTIAIPGVLGLAGLTWLMQTNWFEENIKTPIRGFIREASGLDLFLHLQIFSLVCGILGVGTACIAAAYYFPAAAAVLFDTREGMEGAVESLHERALVPLASGTVTCFILYLYMFADIRNIKWLSRMIIGAGFAVFFVIGRAI